MENFFLLPLGMNVNLSHETIGLPNVSWGSNDLSSLDILALGSLLRGHRYYRRPYRNQEVSFEKERKRKEGEVWVSNTFVYVM